MISYKKILLLTLIHVFVTRVSSVTLSCYSGSHQLSLSEETISVREYQSSWHGNAKACQWVISPSHNYFHLSFEVTSLEFPSRSGCGGKLTIYDEHGKTVTDVCQSAIRFPTSGRELFKRLKIQLDIPGGYPFQNSGFTMKIKQLYPDREGCDLKSSPTGDQNLLTIYSPADLLTTYHDGKENRIYVAEIVNSKPASTVCIGYGINLPSTDTPSCHAANASSCQWIPHSGIKNVTERNDLNGGQFKVSSDFAEFRTKSKTLQMEKVCLYIEYVNGPAASAINHEQNPISLVLQTLSTELNSSHELVHKTLERVDVWTVVRIVQDVSQNERSEYQLAVQLKNADGMYINKLYGCNPFREKDRTLLNDHELNVPIAKNSSGNTSGCKNGGTIKNRFDRRCHCPFGFTGDKCEIGCGKDRWGATCEEECSSTDDGCRYNIFCRGQCLCSSGYMGDRCETECPAGSYGSGCSQVCGKCGSGDYCDPFTGHCPSTCLPGYVPPQCHDKYIQLGVSPNVTGVSYASAKVRALLNGNTVGEGIPLYYITQLKEEGGDWRSIKHAPIADMRIEDEVSGLKPGTVYQARIILKTADDNDYIDDAIRVAAFNTTCLEYNIIKMLPPSAFNNGTIRVQWEVVAGDWRSCRLEEVELQVSSGARWRSLRAKAAHNKTDFHGLLRDTNYMFRARPVIKGGFGPLSDTVNILLDKGPGVILNLKTSNVTSRSAVISWDYTPHKASTFNLTYQCVKVLAGGSCSEDRGSVTVEKASSILLPGLSPHRKYLLNIRRVSTDGSAQTVMTTPPSKPEVAPRVGQITMTNTTAHVVLLPPEDCSLCNGYLTGYRLWDPEANINITAGFNNKEPLKYENLKPLTSYLVHAFLINTVGGHEDHYLRLELNTSGSVPTEVRDLSVYKQGRSEVGLRWSSPQEIYGELESFIVEFADQAITQPPTNCISWPDSYCYIATSLKPDRVYNFSVSAKNKEFNEIGPRSFVIANTSEKAPDAPENLRVVDTWDTGLKVQWNPPKFANGLIRTFLVKIEQIESYTDEMCCHYFPKKEIVVRDENASYTAELSELRPGSQYAVSVMAETVWYGPAAKLYANTTLSPVTSTQPPVNNDTMEA